MNETSTFFSLKQKCSKRTVLTNIPQRLHSFNQGAKLHTKNSHESTVNNVASISSESNFTKPMTKEEPFNCVAQIESNNWILFG
jgi:hypothetical protein